MPASDESSDPPAADEDFVPALTLAWWQRLGLGLVGFVLVIFVLVAIGRWRIDGVALTVLTVTGVIALAVGLIGVVPTYFTHNGLAVQLMQRRQKVQLLEVRRRGDEGVTETVDQFMDLLTPGQLEAVAQQTVAESGPKDADMRRYADLRAQRAVEHLAFENSAASAMIEGLAAAPNVATPTVNPNGPDLIAIRTDTPGEQQRIFVVDITLRLMSKQLGRLGRFAVENRAEVLVLVRDLPERTGERESGFGNLARGWHAIISSMVEYSSHDRRGSYPYALWVTNSPERAVAHIAKGPVLKSAVPYPVHLDLNGYWLTGSWPEP